MDDTQRAVHVLEEELHIREYDVPENHVIRIFEQLENSAEINRKLMLAGIGIKENYLAGQDLEGYFMDLIEKGEKK